ncbi:type II secretion system protein [Acidiferrobacter sp.]|uniref:pilus assembly FimT family protein n=1 Tax=Acidiferrobacter sp. TaxID=1872107 RepID=UPI00341D386C
MFVDRHLTRFIRAGRDNRATLVRPFAAARCSRATPGYTLLELVAVLIVAGVLAAVLAPRFIDATGFTGQTTADKLLMAARYAETLAQNQGVTTSLVVGTGSFSVTQNSVAVANPTLQSASLVVPLPADVTITPQTTVSFARPGVPNATPIFTVVGPGSTVRVDVTASGYIYECGPQGACLP